MRLRRIERFLLKGGFGLSEREIEVVELLVMGMSYGEIGERLFVSKETVKKHVGSVLMKVGVEDRVKLVIELVGLNVIEYERGKVE